MKNLTKKECQVKGWLFTTTGQNLVTATNVAGVTIKAKSLITVRKNITNFHGIK